MTRLLLTPDEARAVRDGRKTQHRMPVEPQPEGRVYHGHHYGGQEKFPAVAPYVIKGSRIPIPSPLGQPGDVVEVVWHEGDNLQVDTFLFATITAVRVERLQDISKADRLSEALECPEHHHRGDCGAWCETLRAFFTEDWNARNPDHPFRSNPWVWVYDLEVTP